MGGQGGLEGPFLRVGIESRDHPCPWGFATYGRLDWRMRVKRKRVSKR